MQEQHMTQIRNFPVEASNATLKVTPKKLLWLVDGMAAVRTLKSKSTDREWIEGFLQFITLPTIEAVVLIAMGNDSH